MLSSKYWNRERYIAVVGVFTTENTKKKNRSINFNDSRQFRG